MVTPVCQTVLTRFSRPRYTGRNWVAGPGQAVGFRAEAALAGDRAERGEERAAGGDVSG